MLKVALLGKPKIELSGRPVEIPSRKGLALFCYLAAGDRAYSRSWLAGLFWAEKTETQARRNLRVALTKLRQQVGEFVEADRTSVGFARHRPHWLDIAQLREAHAALVQGPDQASAGALADARAAVEFVRGPFLEDLPIPDASAFELWLLGEREHYRSLTRELLLALLTQDLARGQHAQGLAAARRLVALDPWQEDAQRWLIHFLALNGQRAAALAQFESCRQILAEELGVAPSAETAALAEAIRAGDIEPPAQATLDAGSDLPAPPAGTEALPAARRHNLLVPATSFVGRERELAQVRQLLTGEACRLLLLLGPGGIGKSRLALEAGRAFRDDPGPAFPDGVFFVPLADLAEASAIEAAVADALGLALRGAAPPLAQIHEHLQEQRLLLILDNFEHLAPRAGLLLDLLGSAPRVKLLVTSRERLPLLEAWNLDLRGLDVPPAPKPGDRSLEPLPDPAAFGAVRLFAERARRADLGFELAAEAEAVAELCRLVGGMPLALELAAAWTRGLSCREIADRIAVDLDALALATPSLPPRQHSVGAVFRHSWALLGEAERRAFAALSCFRGGFTLGAARAVADADRRVLLGLVDKSLLRRTPGGRYDIHILLRRLAARRLADDEAQRLSAGHARHFAALLAEQGDLLHGEEGDTRLAQLVPELDNVRAAWRWAVAAADAALLLEMMEPLSQIYELRGTFAEGLETFTAAAERFAEESVPGARLRARQSRFAFRLGQNPLARRLGEVALPVLEEQDAPGEVARCLLILGNVVRDMGEHSAARAYLQRSRRLFAGEGDPIRAASAANNLGIVHYLQSELPAAVEAFEAALDARRQAGVADTTLELNNVGLCFSEMGRYEEAAAYLEESLEQSRRLDRPLGAGLARHNLGIALRNLGALDASLSHLQGATSTLRALGSRDALAAALADLANTLIALERYAEAQAALEEGMALEKALQRPYGIGYKHLGFAKLYLAQGEDGRARPHLRAVLAGSPEEMGPSLLLDALVILAAVEGRAGRMETAQKLLSGSAAHPQASRETATAARGWAERLGIALGEHAEPPELEALLALGRAT